MPLKIQHIDELDPAAVEAAQAELSQLIQEKYPEVELARGVIHDIVAFFAGGISGAVNQTEINRVLNSRSLLAISENPELSDPELVDHVLSNYLIDRRTGTRAQGNITIVVSGDATVVIAANSLYTANGIDYRTNVPITARPVGSAISDPNDRVLSPRGDGTFTFTVPVTAETVGESGNIRINTRLVPDPPPPRFVTAFSTEDFSGGTTTETNDQLISRMEAGIPAKVTAGRLNISALVKSQPVFADIKNLSIIGYGNAEMMRDQHWIFPASGGGRLDIYCQNTALPKTITLRRPARLIEKRLNESVWQMSLDRDDYPGFYEISAVRLPAMPTDIAGFKIIHDQRGTNLADDPWHPDIVDPTESAYTRYQTAIIRFIDDVTPVADLGDGSEDMFDVSIIGQPLIRELQNFLTGDAHRHLAADILVKAAVPCFLSINCDIVRDASEAAPDLDAIKVAVSDHVNNLNFPGALYASQIIDVIHDYLSGTQVVGPIDIHGRIRRVDGSSIIIRDPHILRLPNSPGTLVTPKTAIFVLYPNDIGLNVVNRNN